MSLPALVDTADLATWRDHDDGFMVDVATAVVRSYCRWHIAPSITETITLSAGPGWLTVLPTLHLTDVVDVTVDALPVEIDGTLVRWSESGFLHWGALYSTSHREVTATITHGFAEVPADVQGVVLSLAESMGTVLGAASSVRVDDASVSYGVDRLSSAHLFILDSYRIISC